MCVRYKKLFACAHRRLRCTASAVNDLPPNPVLMGCYWCLLIIVKVRSQVEEHRIRLELTREQVIFSTDMYGSTSGTYGKKVGRSPSV